jgi:hypothetical protein
MNRIDPKMALDDIDNHIAEFLEGALYTTPASHRRWIARGAYLSGLRDVIERRLQDGWTYTTMYPDDTLAAELWFQLLERYEHICDVLNQYAHKEMRELAASFIFKGERIDNEQS